MGGHTTSEDLRKRIVVDPAVMVEFILGLLTHGAIQEEILEEYPGLAMDDVLACLLFASKALESAAFVPLAVERAWMGFLT